MAGPSVQCPASDPPRLMSSSLCVSASVEHLSSVSAGQITRTTVPGIVAPPTFCLNVISQRRCVDHLLPFVSPQSHLTTVTPQTFRVQPAQQRISWEMASGRSRRRRRSSRDEPPDFCDVTSRHVEQVRSFKRWFDLSEPRMRQMESEFQKVVGQVKEIRRTTDTFIKGGTVSGILGLVICVVGVMAAPFTGGVSLPAAAAFGVAVAAFGRAVAVGAKVKKTIKERCGAKEAEKLGKEFMEIIKPIQNDLEGIQVLHKKLAEKPTDVRGEGVLAETEEFEKILSELRSKRGNMSDVVFAVMKEINATLRLVTNFFRVTATPQEDDKFSDAIFKSAHQYQKVLGEFDLMKMELQDL